MTFMKLAILCSAIGSLLCSCNNNAPAPEPQPSGNPSIIISQSRSTETTVEVSITLENADIAYCMITEAEAATPSLSLLRKAEELTASGNVVFDNLTAGTIYKVHGVAGKDNIFGKIVTTSVKTSGSVDYNFPKDGVKAYLSTADKKMLLADVKVIDTSHASKNTPQITIKNSTKYQRMEGFGPAITGSSAYNLLKMKAADRDKLLRAAFHPTEGLGYSYIRISIGCSDFSLSEFTWCDKQGLENFAVHPEDEQYLFPILREILTINPNVKIIAAPWTAPLWMKIDRYSNAPYDKWAGGKLNPDYYDEYAEYLVRWVKTMESEGFKIEAITPQNEPLHDGNSASTYMSWEQQRNFIKNNLGPAFEREALKTKIWIYDHNFDVTDFVKNIYADKEASKYVEGSAWHAYGGSSSALSQIYAADPSKSIYFTEQSIGTWCPNFGDNLLWHIREVCIGTINNYCRAIVLWNFMLDANRGPNRPGGCNSCYGFVDCDTLYSYAGLNFRSHWYIIGHMSKVIQRDAYRIHSSGGGVLCSAFENPDGTLSAVMLNDGDSTKQVVVSSPKGDFLAELPARSVISLIW